MFLSNVAIEAMPPAELEIFLNGNRKPLRTEQTIDFQNNKKPEFLAALLNNDQDKIKDRIVELYQSSIALRDQGDMQGALEKSLEAEKLLIKSNDKFLFFAIKYGIALYYIQLDKKEETKKYLKEVYDFYVKNKDFFSEKDFQKKHPDFFNRTVSGFLTYHWDLNPDSDADIPGLDLDKIIAGLPKQISGKSHPSRSEQMAMDDAAAEARNNVMMEIYRVLDLQPSVKIDSGKEKQYYHAWLTGIPISGYVHEKSEDGIFKITAIVKMTPEMWRRNLINNYLTR